MNYQAKLSAPFGMLGIRCDKDALTGIDFLPADDKPQRAISPIAQLVCEQLRCYFENPDAPFSIPLKLTGRPVPLSSTLMEPLASRLSCQETAAKSLVISRKRGERSEGGGAGLTNRCANLTIPATPHQQKVWQAMLNIPRGQTRTYGELAIELHSSAQAVGQACGANPIPVIIPCHRIVAKTGLGGFMKSTCDTTLDIKRWLLSHESTNPSPPAPLTKGARGELKAPPPLQGEGWGEGGNAESRSTVIVKVK